MIGKHILLMTCLNVPTINFCTQLNNLKYCNVLVII